jgi:hypothetical protein
MADKINLLQEKTDDELVAMDKVLIDELFKLGKANIFISGQGIQLARKSIADEQERRRGEIQKTTVPMQPGHTEGQAVVWLPFSSYELTNIANMFAAICPTRYPQMHVTDTHERHPFDVLNSGDWTGVVGDRFVNAAKEYAKGARGNHTPNDYRDLASSGYNNPRAASAAKEDGREEAFKEIRRLLGIKNCEGSHSE